jgi:2-oxoglutarate/2-oxoacid ferredoxin oxidoreductase subunit alpha
VSATTTGSTETGSERARVRLNDAVIRFAGDSGDGMQLTGDRFTTESGLAGNDLMTFPDYPAEIRAPAGTVAGVSSFQLHFSDHSIHTAGDAPDMLVAMNPAALIKHMKDLKPGGTVIVNIDEFDERSLTKAGAITNPLEDGSLTDYMVHEVGLTSLTLRALEEDVASGAITKKDAARCKNMLALGLVSFMFSHPTKATEEWLAQKFASKPALAEANIKALKAGVNYGDTTEAFTFTYEVGKAELPAGRYRTISGNQATAYGLVAASQRSGLPLFLGSYPITPATDILHELAKLKHFGVTTFQAEDEIAAMGSTIGAAFGGALAVTTSSGPGIALKTEGIGLAIMYELPVLIVNVQRGGPSTGLPTKTEQSDLLQAIVGRNGEAPVPVVAAMSPGDAFDTVLEAARIALTYRTPVMILTDGYLANSAEPWRIPDLADLPDLSEVFSFTTAPNSDDGTFLPFRRDPETLARPWALPGTKGLEHRLGGLEKAPDTGDISTDGANHHAMTVLRHERMARIGAHLPPLDVDDPDGDADVLVVGWGSTDGPIRAACHTLRGDGKKVAHVQLRHVAPIHPGLEAVMRRYSTVICPENNMGQLAMILRAKTLIDVKAYNRVTGAPFLSSELARVITEMAGPAIAGRGATGAGRDA